MWLNKLKIALVEKDVESLSRLMDNLPQLDSTQDIKEALYLIKEASVLVQRLKDETSLSMKQITKNLHYLKSTTPNTPSRFDIKL